MADAAVVTISIVQSMMMVIPVFAVAVNQHMTVLGNFRALSLRAVNTVTHFTHYTVAHAHLGLYGFFSMMMFGSIYFIMPRVMNWEWPYSLEGQMNAGNATVTGHRPGLRMGVASLSGKSPMLNRSPRKQPRPTKP